MFFGTQGQVTPKRRVWSGRNSNSPQIVWLSWLPASLKMIWSNVKVLSSGQNFLHNKSMEKIFIAQGQVTPKWISRSGPKSNSCEILWLSLLPASLTKIRSKMKSLSPPGQHFPHYKSIGAIIKALKGKYLKSQWSNLARISISDFMPVQIICKSHKDLIKTKHAMLPTRSNMAVFCTQWQVTPK